MHAARFCMEVWRVSGEVCGGGWVVVHAANPREIG